jgi:aldehyde:ferredoxin oxidoreductase
MNFKLLRVDLSAPKTWTEEIEDLALRRYIGGKGLAAFYLNNECEPHLDPLEPNNKLLFFIGPVTGIFPGTSRYVVAAKSPQTSTFSDSYAGGWFPAELAKAGYLGIIIEGKADTLAYLELDDGRVSIKEARELKGKTISEVNRFLKGYRVAAIGPAGENRVRYSCIVNDLGGTARAGCAGRGGLGAVMGSKNLKALAVRARGKPWGQCRSGKIEQVKKDLMDYIKKDVIPGAGIGGNLPVVDLAVRSKVLPVLNFREGHHEHYQRFNEQAVKQIMTKKTTCYYCPVACGVKTRIMEGQFQGLELDRIEYETIAMCGPNCGQTDLGAIAKINQLCNDLGIDTISVGNLMGLLMEASERGLTDYRLEPGDGQGQIELIESIVHRRGIGELLAEGIQEVLKEMGPEWAEIALHVKGLELPGYDPRGSLGLSLAYATADRGGCHMRSWSIIQEAFADVDYQNALDPFTTKGKANLVKGQQDINSALWCLITCDNIGYSLDHAIDMLDAIGMPYTKEEFLEVGERSSMCKRDSRERTTVFPRGFRSLGETRGGKSTFKTSTPCLTNTTEFGAGMRTASQREPFWNVLG